MNLKEIKISPLTSVKKSTKIIMFISLWLTITSFVGFITGGFIYILLPVFIISLVSVTLNLLKLKKLKHQVYLFKDNKLYTRNSIINLNEVSHKIDKHKNLILLKDNKRILKINRLSYNFEILLNYFNNGKQ